MMETIEKGIAYTTADVVDYVPGTEQTVKLVSKLTGSVAVIAVDASVSTPGKISPFDTLVYVIDGNAEVHIGNASHQLTGGQCIILPAHIENRVGSKTRCKILCTVIKSGYET